MRGLVPSPRAEELTQERESTKSFKAHLTEHLAMWVLFLPEYLTNEFQTILNEAHSRKEGAGNFVVLPQASRITC